MSGGAWWERLPDRFLAEHAALRQLEKDGIIQGVRWARDDEGRLAVHGGLRLARGTQGFVLTFPADYPDDCPWVEPSPPARLSTHQFGTAALCLEVGPDNWHAQLCSADIVLSAVKLLELEAAAPEEIPSRHVVSIAERARNTDEWVFLEPLEFDAGLADLPAAGVFLMTMGLRGRGVQVWPVELPVGKAVPGVPPGVRGMRKQEAIFVRLRSDAPPKLPNTRGEFSGFLSAYALGPSSFGDETDVVLLLRDDGTHQAVAVFAKHAFPLVSVPASIEGAAARSPSPPGDPHVTIVGVGSLGSKIAVSLARAGIRRFLVLDPDLLLGHNVCRHEGTMLDVGRSKVGVVKDRIVEVANADVDVTALTFGVSRAESPAVSSILSIIFRGTALVVDATADPSAFNVIARTTSDGSVPMLSAEVFSGGFGGLITWSHPRATPCPRCVRRSLHTRLAELPDAPRDRSTAGYGAGDGSANVATDADVSFIAAGASSLALTLASGGLPEGPPLLLVGQRRGWVFERPFTSFGWEVLSDDVACERCWKVAVDPSPELLSEVERILSDADRSTST